MQSAESSTLVIASRRSYFTHTYPKDVQRCEQMLLLHDAKCSRILLPWPRCALEATLSTSCHPILKPVLRKSAVASAQKFPNWTSSCKGILYSKPHRFSEGIIHMKHRVYHYSTIYSRLWLGYNYIIYRYQFLCAL